MAALEIKAQQFPNPLHVPDTLKGPSFDLLVKPSKALFVGTDSSDTYGINADYLGPTLIFSKDDSITLNVTNKLGETTTMHWHGMHVSPENDGGPHTPILADSTWSPSFKVLDEATTFWYHPHLHHKTAEQVYAGAAGMIIVRDQNPAGNQLPHHYGVDEFPLIIQDKSFDNQSEFIYTQMADTMMVNGTLGAFLEVPAQMVRFHLLNASNQRVYNLGFTSNIIGWQVGSDGGLLENRLPLNRVQIAPGERAEIVIDFRSLQDSSVVMTSYNSELSPGVSGGPRGPRGQRNNLLDSVDFEIMEFRVIPQNSNPILGIPNQLNNITRPLEANADRFRVKEFTVDSSGFPFYINGSLMDMTVINDTVKLDDIEVWTLINNTDEAHPWHIHDVQFFVLDINGNPPPPDLRGRKDVVLVLPYDTVRYITQFEDFANDTIPYMFHCHNLFHEDGGMMGQFIVVNEVGLEEINSKTELLVDVYPNPNSSRLLTIQTRVNGQKIQCIKLIDSMGKEIEDRNFRHGVNKEVLHLEGISSGIYFLSIQIKGGEVESIPVIID